MKKIIYPIIFLVIMLIFTACMETSLRKELSDELYAVQSSGAYNVYSDDVFQALEIGFNADFVSELDQISVNPDLMKIRKRTDSGIILALINPDSVIGRGDFLFTVPAITSKDIISVNVIDGDSVRASIPLPNGVSVLDTEINTNQSFDLYIYTKNLSTLQALEFTLNFDPNYIIVDPAYGDNYLEVLGTFQPALLIKSKTNNSITLSFVFQQEVNITEELSFKLRMKSLSTNTTTNVTFSGTSALNSSAVSLGTAFNNGGITVNSSLTPELLGDFDSDDQVDIQDFLAFVTHYNSSSGDGTYETLYDIGPAQDYFKGDWDGIYDVANPDGAVNIIDFIVFANNYGLTKPTNDNQPPSVPGNPDPVDNAQNVSTDPVLEWTASTDPENDTISYEVYFGTVVDPQALVMTVDTPLATFTGLSNSTTYYWKVVAKDSNNNRTEGDIWRFTTLAGTNNPPSAPINPSPSDSATGVNTSVTLSWGASTDPDGDTVAYDFYFGTSTNPSLVISNLGGTSYSRTGLSNDTQYYWKVVAKDTHSNTTSSSIWTFRTIPGANNPPTAPTGPNPASGSTDQETSLTLSWTASTDADGDPVTYDVYMDKTSNPTTFKGSVSGTSFNVSNLSYATLYYWKVVAKDNNGGSTSGSVWNLTTKAAPSGNASYRGITLGLTDYGGSSDLSATDDDADEIKITFENLSEGFSIQKETGNVVKSEIQNWLTSYVSGSQTDDVFVFHYSGHGFYESGQSRMYLSDGSDMSMSELRTLLDNINGTKIVLIDACQSGNFTDMSSGRVLTTEEKLQQMAQFRAGVLSAFEESETNRGTYSSPYEYYVLAGSAIDEYSNEDSHLNHGFFSFFFCDGLGNVGSSNPNGSFDATYNADGYGPGGVADGNVTHRELYNYSKDKVSEYMQSNYGVNDQTIQGNHTDSDYVVGSYSGASENPPSKPSSPTPSDGSSNVSVTQSLSWSSSGATSYDVYFGTSSTPPLVSSGQSYNNYNPGTMNVSQPYYWKIVAHNAYGTTTGDVWDFTTASGDTPSSSDGKVVLKTATPEVTGDMEFDYYRAYFDTNNPTPPHWKVRYDGSLYFTFNGAEDFYFNAYGLRDQGYDAEIDVYINGDYVGYFVMSASWGQYIIESDYFSSGENEVELNMYWGSMYIDEIWTGDGQTTDDPPSVPSNPSPSNGSNIQNPTPTLSWSSTGADNYDVYFGTSSNPPKVSTAQTASTYSPSTLSIGQTYYWKIVAKNTYGSTAGSIWSFSVSGDTPQTGVDFTSPYSGNYLLISNESSNGDSTEYTGSLSSERMLSPRNTEYAMPRGLPLEAYRIDPQMNRDIELDRSLLVDSEDGKLVSRAVGDTRQFTVYNFKTDSDQTITATLQAVGSRCEVWAQNTSEITTTKAQQAASEFDSVIYPQVTSNFYTPSDVNSDGKVAILMFDIQDDFDSTGSYVGGYFWARDLFNMAGSNLMEIFYIDTYPTMHYPQSNAIDVSEAYSTLAHEFQHMVNFNRNYLVEGGDDMPSWIDEGLSMAAERLVYGSSEMTGRINYYNSSPSIKNGHSLLYWDDYGDTLANYSLSYLFMQYFRIQMGQGNAIYREIIEDYANDYSCIQNALNAYASSISFGDFMTNWRIALMLKESSGAYGFGGDSSFDPLSTQIYSGGSTNLRGGGAVVKTLVTSYTDPGNSGAHIQYVGMP
ncbi:MAG TPA: caspase family protein [Thermotogota bacterium]|nr:caspase family protein [Thermotogota bacterium]